MKSYKGKTIALDFDGVFNTYTKWDGEDNLYEPREGLTEFLETLKYTLGATLVIFTCRDTNKIKEWLIKYDLDDLIKDITNFKPKCEVYIDDRGIHFDGDYNKVLFNLELFQPHWK